MSAIVVGLGKTGVSCLRYLRKKGVKVAACDSRPNPPDIDKIKQEFPDVIFQLGNFDTKFLCSAHELVVSPGVSLKEPAIAAAIAQGVKVSGDIELFARANKVPVIAITGSNGKSTVTTLVGEMAKAAGLKTYVGGNLGIPVLEFLDLPTPDLYVLELSSFQLETTSSLKPKAAVILNISEDHMDRYRDLDDYLAAKRRIYNGAEWIVINRDDKKSYEGASLGKNVFSFGLNPVQDERETGLADGLLFLGKEKLLPATDLKIKGHHQIANALAAIALGHVAGLPLPAMIKALRSFAGLPHRCQYVATINAVSFYNDSKGTNVGATEAAVFGIGESIAGKIILIAGGIGKGADFSPLRKVCAKYVRTLILIGRDAPIIEKTLAGSTEIVDAASFDEAVKMALNKAVADDAVLLSPACASFDMFKNFEHRGEEFVRLVKELE